MMYLLVHYVLQQRNEHEQLLEAYNASQQSLQQSASTISVSACLFWSRRIVVIFYLLYTP